MPGDVDERHVLPQDLRAAAEQGVDGAADHPLVPRDHARGEDHEVARARVDVLVLARRDERDGGVRLALAPRREDHLARGGQIAELVERDDEPLGHPEVAQLRGDRDVGHHAPAEEPDPALVADGQVEELLDAVDVRGEGRHDDASRRLGKPPVEGRAHLGLRARMPRPADIGRVRAEGQHAALAQRGERRVVRLLVVDGVLVELEIPGVDDRAHRRLDRETDAVGDRVGHADGRDGEAAQHDLVPGP